MTKASGSDAGDTARPTGGLSAVVVVHNEEAQLAACLRGLGFCDEIVAVLDRCTDASLDIALGHS